jgi:hypothetical protein
MVACNLGIAAEAFWRLFTSIIDDEIYLLYV